MKTYLLYSEDGFDKEDRTLIGAFTSSELRDDAKTNIREHKSLINFLNSAKRDINIRYNIFRDIWKVEKPEPIMPTKAMKYSSSVFTLLNQGKDDAAAKGDIKLALQYLEEIKEKNNHNQSVNAEYDKVLIPEYNKKHTEWKDALTSAFIATLNEVELKLFNYKEQYTHCTDFYEEDVEIDMFSISHNIPSELVSLYGVQ